MLAHPQPAGACPLVPLVWGAGGEWDCTPCRGSGSLHGGVLDVALTIKHRRRPLPFSVHGCVLRPGWA